MVFAHGMVYSQVNEIKAEYIPVSEKIALQGIRQMYNFQFDESRASFEEFKSINPNLPSGYFYLVVLDWFTLRMMEDDKQVWREMSRKLEEVITVAERRLEKYPEDALSMVYLGAARGMKARIALSKNDWIDTFYDSQAGFTIIKEAMRMDPSMIDPLIGLGVFHYFIAVSNPVIKSLAYMAGLKSSKEEALGELHLVAEKGMYASIEARSFLMFVYAYFEEEYSKAYDIADGLVKEFDNSPYFRGKYADILLMNGMVDKAKFHIDMIPKLAAGLPEKYQREMKTRVDYLNAERLRMKGKPREALELLNGLADDYTLEFKFNTGYIYLRTGMAYDQIGDRKSAKKFYKKAVKLDNYTSAVRHAKSYLKEPYTLNRNGG